MVYLSAVVEESIKSFWVGFVFCLSLETGFFFVFCGVFFENHYASNSEEIHLPQPPENYG